MHGGTRKEAGHTNIIFSREDSEKFVASRARIMVHPFE